MMKRIAASVMAGSFAVLAFGACSVEPPQTSDFEPAEGVGSASQALSTCVDVQRGLYGTVEDTFIGAAAPGVNSGSYPNIYSGLDAGAEKRSLLKFDLGFIPAGSTVDSATLTLFQTWKTDASSVRVHRVTAAWSEMGATWNNSASSYDPSVAATIDAASGFGSRTADVTALVQGFVDGSYANEGVLLEEELVHRTIFRGSETSNQADRPMLTVCYTEPSCTDGVQNQGETGVDCGGPCAACPPSGVAITPPGVAYGHHGMCSGWNGCGDAATCALWACQINGYSNLVSYGAAGPCTGFDNCHLFYSRGSIQWNWGNWCAVNGVSEIVCSN